MLCLLSFYGLLAIFLGSSLLTLGSSCSVLLFWCYEVSSWGLVVLYAGTAFFLRRRAALTNDEGEFGNRNHQGLEMLEANPLEFTPDVERKHGWIHLCYHLMKKTNLSITMKFPQDHDS